MNLFKKTIATIALVTLVSGIFSAGVSASSSTEVEAANALAAKGYIVNHSSNTANYNLNQNVLRQEIAAVARGIAGLDKKTTCDNSFADVSATTPNTWACYSVEALLDAGLIAANTNFNPEANISKAEAVGMMVKAAFGDEYAYDSSKSTSWQAQVVAFAVSKGVVKNFTNYDAAATRGFVFEAGNNADVASEVVEKDSLDDLFCDLIGGCDTTDTTTDTTTDDTVVISTDNVLQLSLNPSSAADGTQVPKTGTIRFAVVDVTAGSSDASLNTIELSKEGLASIPTSTRVWFEKDGKRLSGKSAFSSDGKAVISFAPAFVVKAGSTESLDFYVELATTSGQDFKFSGVIGSSSANNEGSFMTASLRTADYTVAPVVFNISGSNSTYNQSADELELGRFTIKNSDLSPETRDTKVQNITLKQNGNGDLAALADLYIERSGVRVSTEVTIDGRNATFVLNDMVKDGATATYYIKSVVSAVENNAGDTYQFELRNDTDLNVVEVLNGFRSTVTGKQILNTYTVTGSDLVFARDSSVELSKNYAKWTNDVILMQGTITAKTAITLEDITLGYTANGNTDSGAIDMIDTVYLQIGSSLMTWSPTATWAAEFLGLATVNGTVDVKMYTKLKDNATTGNIKFDDLKLSSISTKEYVSNQNNVTSSIGTISAVQVSVDTTNLTVTRVDGLGDTKIAVGSKAVLVQWLNLTVSQGNDVSISNAEFTVTASGSYSNNVFATLYIDGTAVSTKTVSGTTLQFNGVNSTVWSTPVKMEVKVDFSDSYTDGDFAVSLSSLDIIDSLTSQTVTLGSTPSGANFTVAQAKGTLSSSDNNPNSSLLLAGSKNVKLLAFRIKAENDNVKLRDVVFTGSNLDKLSNLRILTPTNATAVSTAGTSTGVEFKNLSLSDTVLMDKTDTYYLIADINTNVAATSVAATLLMTWSTIKATNGSLVAVLGSDVASNAHLIDENMAVVAKLANSSKDLSTSALRFSVTASGKDGVTLSGATFDNVLSGYTGATTLTVYKTSVSTANIVGTGGITGAVTFTANQTVDAGSTNNYIVVINGTIDASANTPAWTVRLTNLEVGSISANLYTNMGEFPLTETK